MWSLSVVGTKREKNSPFGLQRNVTLYYEAVLQKQLPDQCEGAVSVEACFLYHKRVIKVCNVLLAI